MMHTVIYKFLKGAGMLVTREMTQEELAQLLLSEDMELVSVNAPKPTYTRRKRK